MSFPRRTRDLRVLVVILAAGITPCAAAVQETTTAPSAAPRAVAATPTGATNAPTTGVSSYQQQPVKRQNSWLGEAAGGSLTEPVLVIPGKPLEGQALSQAVEDLSVMSRIIEKNAFGEDAASEGAWGMIEYKAPDMSFWTGMGLGILFPAIGRAKPMYVGGYGALFFMQVNYPLLAPPETPQEQPGKSQEDAVWAEARRSVLDPQAQPMLPQEAGEAVEPYSREQVDALRHGLITTLKHATNIRVLEPGEWVTIVVQGVAPVAQDSSPAPAALPVIAAPGGRTVMTLRATKADVDQYAKGQLDQKQFEQRVRTVTY